MIANDFIFPPNIIVFGQTGAGKSSLINMLARTEVAVVSNQAAGFTSSNRSYNISPPNDYGKNLSSTYVFWDTAGLNEGDHGTVPMQDALENLLKLVNEQSVNLVIYCIRGSRLTPIVRVNYDLFWGIICEGKVPIVLVVTGLELENNMDGWWKKNNGLFQQMGLSFDGLACVTTAMGRDDTHNAKFWESEEKVWHLIREHCSPRPWSISPGWIPGAHKSMKKYMEAYNSRNGNERNALPPRIFQRFNSRTSRVRAISMATGSATTVCIMLSP